MQTGTFKQHLLQLLRCTGLLQAADQGWFLWDRLRHSSANNAFRKQHPDFRLPPPDLAYDAYGSVNWTAYHATGRVQAQFISDLITRYTTKTGPLAIAEWGCGPARILRHLPNILPCQITDLTGFDYNPRTIAWCRDAIPEISFACNNLLPPLPVAADSFDCLYCISVFTHLSENLHYAWMEELSRIVRPGGIIIITTHGDAFRGKLLPHEREEYDRGRLVVRDKVREGKRCFAAYQPPSFMTGALLAGYKIAAHLTEAVGSGFIQDHWVVRNR